LFDKTNGANWGVFWHQDLSIAVKSRYPHEGYRNWTYKAGIHCVQPPAEIMSRILAVRLHLDDCSAENGALKVLPGSHRSERLTTDRIEQFTGRTAEVICEVPAGGALLMNPLLLHSSSPMNRPGHRRVIHLEFAAEELPAPLEWRYRIQCLRDHGDSAVASTETPNPRRRSGGTTVVDN
jgi:ectoine hydroxylase-related dioxygenase (phytanoyl-CoA dioxygenase family)